MLSLNFASKILDTNIKSCLTQKRVSHESMKYLTNAKFDSPNLMNQNLLFPTKKKRVALYTTH